MMNPEYVRVMQELRRSNATAPVPSGKRYKRKPKHPESSYKSSKYEHAS